MERRDASNRAAALEAARHLCQEARVVLTSLRGGPPNVARGDLAQDLLDMRGLVKYTLSNSDSNSSNDDDINNERNTISNNNIDNNSMEVSHDTGGNEEASLHPSELNQQQQQQQPPTPTPPQLGKSNASAATSPLDVGPFARPFLAVVMDPRAAGPHTLVALRALFRLLDCASLIPWADSTHVFSVSFEPLTKGVLNCKFEQTDAGADEAVEMAIADLLALLVKLDRRAIRSETLMDAFNTVFVTRNTFVHSPALCYHFEDVLTTMIKIVFSDLDSLRDPAGKLILEFLVNQLLHTPLVKGDDEASREAQMAHDATRVLCLRLTRAALRTGFTDFDNDALMDAAQSTTHDEQQRTLLQIIQDDLCLSLLMTGQAIWAYQDNRNVSPGFISLEVLSEICSTLSVLWTSKTLRKFLVPQFESIFTGFYQRALVLLRKRLIPTDSTTFHENLVFDAGVEIILESLVDVMCLHDHKQTIAQGNGGALESLFSMYDCNMRRSDVAVGLMVELCRCTGSKVDEDGDMLEAALPTEGTTITSNAKEAQPAGEGEESKLEDSEEWATADTTRQVPPHLKELCAEAIIGGMKCLFCDDHASEKTRSERQTRQSILAGHITPAPESLSDLERVRSSHHLRNIKSQKRLMRQAAQLFNKKPSKGIEFLVKSGVLANPVTPRSVASFLRNGIVVGLDKAMVGSYLGEVGKSPIAGKSPPDWERDWFHKEVLSAYCSLFRFERQSLLDGLRMFLAAFRLPGEAQQIDRILQAFADSCSQLCDEGAGGATKIFSDDPKRASDAAYLLSFSIIMLNTDQHNENIREDRKMKKEDFVRNNTDYGRDITEPGKEFPKEYLEAIYSSIREEEIRTEGEGADGSMTIERWKDVLRGSAEEGVHANELPTVHDAEDLSELVLEHLWMPIMSAISALWGVKINGLGSALASSPMESGSGGMLGAQGARLGMDMAWDMLVGVRNLGRSDIFGKIFNCICAFSGLLDYNANVAERAWIFANSVEAQSALIVALRVARDANDEIGVEGWKRIWVMLFELRDLKMLGGGVSCRTRSLLMESDTDLLKENTRREWNMKLVKKGSLNNDMESKKNSSVSSMFGAMGRALFGSVEDPVEEEVAQPSPEVVARSVHGKEEPCIWDELGPSDDEDEVDRRGDDVDPVYSLHHDSRLSLGAQFESHLIQEDLLINQQREMPVTGLERVDDTNHMNLSPRARARKRLSHICDFAGIISESRLMDDGGLSKLLQALIDLTSPDVPAVQEGKQADGDFLGSTRNAKAHVSPASEAFAEVVICELTLRNRDRFAMLWENQLKAHYSARLTAIAQTSTNADPFTKITGGMEKSITGMLRISSCAVQRGDIANEVLKIWSRLDMPGDDVTPAEPLLDSFDRHLGEGLWRICRCVDDAKQLSGTGWAGLLSLVHWCAKRGGELPPIRESGIGRPVGLAEDDPALQAYRSLHFLLNVSDSKECVPVQVVPCIGTLIRAGENRRCPKLCIAGLDLLQVICKLREEQIMNETESEADTLWNTSWRPVLEEVASVAGGCSISNVRQHALSMLTDTFLDKRAGVIPLHHLCGALDGTCIPLAGKRIAELKQDVMHANNLDEVMIELDLCVGLMFKPLRHHMEKIAKEGRAALESVWGRILQVLLETMGQGGEDPNTHPGNGHSKLNQVLQSTDDMVLEHLRNIIMVLIGYGAIKAQSSGEDGDGHDMTTRTWDTIGKLKFSKFLDEWKEAAKQGGLDT